MTSDGTGSTEQGVSTRHGRGTGQPRSGGPAGDTGQKRSGRRPEGPPHARKGSMFQTVKRTLTEFKEDNLTDVAAALTYYAVLFTRCYRSFPRWWR